MGGACFLLAAWLILASLSKSINGRITESCDYFQGSWVQDNSYPLYDATQCPFIEKIFTCQKNGRPDTEYMKYKWQPSDCSLPRFNGRDFLRKIRGKSLIFVGDSLSLNQWQSLTCLLHVAVPQANYTLERNGGLSIFTFPEYGTSLMFLRNAYLVDIVHEPRGRVLRLDSISTSKIWGGKNIMIFDSWHWWLHSGRKQAWDWVVYGNTTVKDMDRLSAYEKALHTWAKWIDSNVDPSKTKVFFQGVSPDNPGCEGQIRPLEKPGSPQPADVTLQRVLRGMAKPVNFLNINLLSQLRIDGHPSYYGLGGHRGDDCTHWCLSGVPDIWNEFLYAMMD